MNPSSWQFKCWGVCLSVIPAPNILAPLLGRRFDLVKKFWLYNRGNFSFIFLPEKLLWRNFIGLDWFLTTLFIRSCFSFFFLKWMPRKGRGSKPTNGWKNSENNSHIESPSVIWNPNPIQTHHTWIFHLDSGNNSSGVV